MKMKNIFWLPSLIIAIIFISLSSLEPSFLVDEEKPVADVLEALGEAPMPHQVDQDVEGASAEKGRELVHIGITTRPAGGKTGKQSKHFVCTSCHNTIKEDPDLSVSDPQARLEYAKENGLPYLQGTTLYGAVNRTKFYNGDYQKKYGDLVEPARNNLREAIQLCAVECSQGRRLEPWEMESVLAYLWTIGLKMEDLSFDQQEYAKINKAINGDGDKNSAVKLINSRFLKGSPATFVDPPPNRKEGYPVKGNPDNGKLVYELSCLHCHEKQRYSFYKLDDNTLTFKHLKKHITRYTRYSMYQVGRYGTPPMPGKKAYMPNYTAQKLSNQQMEDLRAYIELRAGE
jgi:mono/diheme cytochrome c family protein